MLSLQINFTAGTFAAENSALRIQIPRLHSCGDILFQSKHSLSVDFKEKIVVLALLCWTALWFFVWCLGKCICAISSVWVLEIPKSSITLKSALWALGESRAAEGFPQLGKLSDCEEIPYLFSGHVRHFSLVKLKLQCAGHGMNSEGQSSSLLPVMADLSAGWEQLKWLFHQKYRPQCSGKGNPRWVQTLLFPCLYQQNCAFSKFLARGLGLEHYSSLKQFAAGGYGGAISQF